MQLPRHVHIAIGVAAFAGLCASVALSLFWFGPQTSPADLLPAENVSALFSGITAENASPFIDEFPQLVSVPLPSDPSVLALMHTNDGIAGWILFTKQSIPGASPFSVSSSSPDILALLAEPSVSSLAESPAYRAAEEDGEPGMKAYLHFPALSQPQHPLFTRFAAITSPLMVTTGSGGMTISWRHESDARPLSHLAPPVFDQELLTMQAGDGTDVARSITDRLSKQNALVLRGAMTSMLQAMFGDGLSPRYDLLPLMEREYALHVARAGDDWSFVLRGSADDAGDRLQKLHELFASRLPASETRTHAFDDSFTMTDIRRSEDAISDVTTRENGWDVRRTMESASGSLLISARRGRDFLLANDAEGLQRALTAGRPPLTGRSVVARGFLAAKEVQAFLHAIVPTLMAEQSGLPFALGGNVEWTLMDEGGMRKLRIEQEGEID